MRRKPWRLHDRSIGRLEVHALLAQLTDVSKGYVWCGSQSMHHGEVLCDLLR